MPSNSPHAARRPLQVLIAGGGVAALEALIGLRELAQERVEIELLAPRPEYVDRPLAVAEPFGRGRPARFDLKAIAGDRGAGILIDGLDEVDAAGHRALTTRGEALGYDVLVVAVGARPGVALEGAVTLRGPDYTSRFRTVLRELEERHVRRVAFAVPPGAAWPLPLYELALMTAAHVAERRLRKVELRFVTPEAEPLELFGAEASAALRRRLEEAGIELLTQHYPASVEDDGLALVPADAGHVPAERVVSLPQLRGPRVPGLPHDAHGFIPTDLHGLVQGEEDVYAAGDATTFPIKQGGIATQHADAVAEAIAARAGAPVVPRPFEPVLRGMLLTGGVPQYMRAEVGGGKGEDWDVSEHALWWPPTKIAGRWLSPYLALRAGEAGYRAEPGGVPVEVRLDPPAAEGGIRRRAVIAPSESGGAVTFTPGHDRR